MEEKPVEPTWERKSNVPDDDDDRVSATSRAEIFNKIYFRSNAPKDEIRLNLPDAFAIRANVEPFEKPRWNK